MGNVDTHVHYGCGNAYNYENCKQSQRNRNMLMYA